jgi:hypothetical protein
LPIKLSRRERRALKGLEGMPPEFILLIEIIARVKCIHEDNLDEIDLIAWYGSPENATAAIKRGEVSFELMKTDEETA